MSRAAGAIRVVRSRSRPLVAQRKALTFTPAAISRLKVRPLTRGGILWEISSHKKNLKTFKLYPELVKASKVDLEFSGFSR